MKRGRSTTTPTKAEADRIKRSKVGPCMACLAGAAIGRIDPRMVVYGCDYNHTKSGNIRRGHLFGYALCLWHHHGTQQLHALGMTKGAAYALWGPSLFDESKRFHALFGTDDELIEQQTRYLEHGCIQERAA